MDAWKSISARYSGKARRLATDTGRSEDEFVRDAMAGHFDELARMRKMLGTRYDEAINDPGQFVAAAVIAFGVPKRAFILGSSLE